MINLHKTEKKSYDLTSTSTSICDMCGNIYKASNLHNYKISSNQEKEKILNQRLFKRCKPEGESDNINNIPEIFAICNDCILKYRNIVNNNDIYTVLNEKIGIQDYGYVELIDHMGNDKRIVECARESYDLSEKDITPEKIDHIIHLLINSGHSSPFEQVVFEFKIKCPIFVARQIVRHRTARMNELSARYTELKPEFFIPNRESFKARGKSDTEIDEIEKKCGAFLEIDNKFNISVKKSYDDYKEFLDKIGIPKELARIVLPLGIYTEFYWQMDLNNLMKFLYLRLDEHAQTETRQYAIAIYNLIKKYVPITMKYFISDKFNTVTYNKDDIEKINNIISHLFSNIYGMRLNSNNDKEEAEDAMKILESYTKKFNKRIDEINL